VLISVDVCDAISSVKSFFPFSISPAKAGEKEITITNTDINVNFNGFNQPKGDRFIFSLVVPVLEIRPVYQSFWTFAQKIPPHPNPLPRGRGLR
jgi:hypothetical protein